MKKLIVLSLIAIGIGAASTTAHAGGFSVGITLPVPRLPFFLPPPPLILAPPAVVVRGYERPVVYEHPVVVREYCPPVYRSRIEVRHDRFEDRRFNDRRDDRFDHGRPGHR